MTTLAPKALDRLAPLQAVIVVGGAAVFLLATAGLLNMALAGAPKPPALGEAAVIAHLTTVLAALPLGLSQLVLPKGTTRHRIVGYVWLALMVFTALVSFAIHTINRNGLSPIHLFSILTLVSAPVIAYAARRGQVATHRRAVLGLMGGGLVIAGIFTFIPGRALGQLVWSLFGRG
jgi:uncharacterized membrane protein